MDLVLVAPATVDVDPREPPQVPGVTRDEFHGVVAQPVTPALAEQRAGFHVERHPESVRRRLVRIVGRRHAEIHDRVTLGQRQLVLFPYLLEEALDAAIVETLLQLLSRAEPTSCR